MKAKLPRSLSEKCSAQFYGLVCRDLILDEAICDHDSRNIERRKIEPSDILRHPKGRLEGLRGPLWLC